jgi:hypothetical protein
MEGSVMKKIVSAIFLVLAFFTTSAVYADKGFMKISPESIMTCGGGNGNSISVLSVPKTINTDECPAWVDGECASCVISLEKQGCKVVDVVVTHLSQPNAIAATGTTYLLSCTNP